MRNRILYALYNFIIAILAVALFFPGLAIIAVSLFIEMSVCQGIYWIVVGKNYDSWTIGTIELIFDKVISVNCKLGFHKYPNWTHYHGAIFLRTVEDPEEEKTFLNTCNHCYYRRNNDN